MNQGNVILFQGDSITDCDRTYVDQQPNSMDAMGRGYAFQVASWLLMQNPGLDLKVLNRGISGHRVPDLAERWDRDCLALKPDLLSILVGVNDIGHKMSGQYFGTVEDYEVGFTALLERTRRALPDTALVICEPFVLRCGVVTNAWFPEFDQRRAAAKRVAAAAGAHWVPFQDMFDNVLTNSVPPEFWADDGVHPSMAGHALMAREWLKVVCGAAGQ